MRSSPERSCLVCRRKRPKQELVRIAHSAERGLILDLEGIARGRGAYVCGDDASCRSEVARKGTLARALRTTLHAEDLARLTTEIEKESVEA